MHTPPVLDKHSCKKARLIARRIHVLLTTRRNSKRLPVSRNNEMTARSLRAVWHPCTQMKLHEKLPLIPISRGDGAWLYDFEGNRYLDAISSWWVNLFGHANARIAQAVRDQAATLEHVLLAGFTHEPVVSLAERLARQTGLSHCHFASDGSSAVEIALKMSFHFWRNGGQAQKTNFVSIAGAYHGETAGALSVTDIELYREVYRPLLRPLFSSPSPDWRTARSGESARDVAMRAALALDAYLEANRDSVAAVIVEPLVQCASGMAMHHPDYLRLAREACSRHQVHLIADEIAVGFGRTGSFLACDQAQIKPDFLCLSKGITGGFLPLSVVLTSDAVYSQFYDEDVSRAFLHSHSYTGNPLACRAALAVLDIFEQDDVLAGNRRTAARLNERAGKIAAHPGVRDFRNTGMIWAFELECADPLAPRRFYLEALERGLLLRPLGNTVYFMPPYVIDEEQIELLVDGTVGALEAILLAETS
jgi:adenosylmethionine---8-amino-7-oxononanoate aminotransferase